MVDAMWRQQRELLDVASDDARLKLRQWELPEALQVHRREHWVPTQCCKSEGQS